MKSSKRERHKREKVDEERRAVDIVGGSGQSVRSLYGPDNKLIGSRNPPLNMRETGFRWKGGGRERPTSHHIKSAES